MPNKPHLLNYKSQYAEKLTRLVFGLKVYLNCPPLSDFCFWKGLFNPIIELIVFRLCIGGVVLLVVLFLSAIKGGLIETLSVTVVNPLLVFLFFPKLLMESGQDRGCLSPIGDLSLGSFASSSSTFSDLVLD